MPGKSLQELPRLVDYQDDDLFYIVRNVGGTPRDRAIERRYIAQNIRKAELVITSAQVLALNTTPQQLVAAPGSGKVIVPLRGLAQLAGVGTSYATHTNAVVGGASAVSGSDYWGGFSLSATADVVRLFNRTATIPHSILDNEAVVLTTPSGDPTAGDAGLRVQLWYLIADL